MFFLSIYFFRRIFCFLWPRVASRRVASNGCRAKEEDVEDKQHQGQQQDANQEEFAPRVAEIHGPPQAEALRDKHSRIVGIVVQ